MKKKINLVTIFAVLFCLMTFSNASAVGILAGEWGVGNFDQIVQESTNDIFVSPGIELSEDYTQLNDSTFDADTFNQWTVIFDASGLRVTTEGPDIDVLTWFYDFNTAYVNTPFSFEFYGYLDGALIDWATVTYDGGTYGASTHGSPLNNGDNFTFVGHNIEPVPEPTTLLLLGSGLFGLAGFRKKLKK